MKQIKSIDTSRFRTEEDFGFQKQILAEAETLTSATDKAMVDAYKSTVTAFDEALKASSASAFTPALEEADAKADTAWRGITATVKAQLQHPTEAVRDAATEAYAIVKKYGDVTAMPYNEEYGSLHNALQDFTTLGTEKQKLTFIDAWVTELQTRYDEFVSIREQRTAETGAKVQGIVKQSRTDCDEAYKTLVSCVNALAILQGETAYATFIDNVNVIIDKAKSTLAARKTRSRLAAGPKVNPAASQPSE